jgi:hypothetical protein
MQKDHRAGAMCRIALTENQASKKPLALVRATQIDFLFILRVLCGE